MERSLQPLVVGHRGNPAEFPDNSRSSIESAVRLGVDVVEVDVRLSRDGVPVLVHDPTVWIDGREVPVAQLDWAQLRQLPLSPEQPGETIATLPEALEIVRGRATVNLDLKDPAAIPAMVRAVWEARMRAEVVVSGCTEPLAARVRAWDPTLPVFLNLDDPLERIATASFRRFVEAALRRVARAGLRGVNFPHRLVEPTLIAAAQRRGMVVWAWTVDDPERMITLIRQGVDAITTNRPARLLQLREEERG